MIRPQASKPGSGSRFRGSFGRQKPSFLENFRTTLSGPQHLPIAKNEEAKRHDRGTLSQNEAFVACPALRANNAFAPSRSVRSAKNNSPASSSAVDLPRRNAITGMTSKSQPIARTLRSAVAAAINEAIGGTNADPVSQG